MVGRAVRFAAFVIVVVFAGWYLFRQGDTLAAAVDRIGILGLAVPFGFALCYWVSLGLLWAVLQARLGGGLPALTAMRIWALSTVARYVPGNIWHIAGRTALVADAGGEPFAALTASVYEQAVTLAGALLVAGVLLPLVGGLNYLPGLLAVPAALLILHPRVQRLIVDRAARRAQRPPPSILSMRRLAQTIAWYAVPTVPAGLALWWLAPAAPPLAAVGAFAVAWSIGYVSFFTPSGLGVREIALAGALAIVAPSVDGPAIAVVHRLVLTVAEMAIALVALGLIPKRLSAGRTG